MAAAGAIQRKHLSNGSIRWLLAIPRICSIRQCAPQCTAASAWWSIFLSFACYHNHIKPSNATLNQPFGKRWPMHWNGCIHQTHATTRANGTTMVVMFLGELCWFWLYFPYYSYRRNPTGRSFLFRRNPYSSAMLWQVLLECLESETSTWIWHQLWHQETYDSYS